MSKQFLLLCDEVGMYKLQDVFKEGTIQFLEVQGLNLNAENKLNILVTPVLPPVTPAIVQPMSPPQPQAPAEPAPEAVPPLEPTE